MSGRTTAVPPRSYSSGCGSWHKTTTSWPAPAHSRATARVYTYEEEEDKADEEHVAEILIAKHRNGPTGVEKLTFLPEYAKFGNYQNPARI